MKIKQLDHINLRTPALDRMVAFYCEVLGFEKGARPPFDFGGAWLYCGTQAAIHLVEIDLLRAGEHTTPMSLERLRRKAGPFDYHVSVHRFDQPGRFFLYPWKLEIPLPEIAVPLLPRHGEVPLDLQAVFTRCYDTGPYQRRVRYEPDRIAPPLGPEREQWLKDLLAGAPPVG